MKYKNIAKAKFVNRPNRFVANLKLNGMDIKAHVPNTGRCGELFVKDADVIVSRYDNPKRKLEYSLISVYKGNTLVNIDSQNPNRLVYDYLAKGRLLGKIPDIIKKEYTYGNSRIDFMFEDSFLGKGLIEVKGCTLEKEGCAYFPDAPTARGVKHLRELIKAKSEGWKCYVVFVIQMKGVDGFSPNRITHPEFADTLAEARAKGVEILAFDSNVTPCSVEIAEAVEVFP